MTEPPWMIDARAAIGVRETPGPGNSPTIMGWARRLGGKVLGMAYGADAIPWCGLFVAECMVEADIKPPPIAVRAKAWATWGAPCPPQYGAVLVFARDGGGHVGFYSGETPTAYQVLGGNQGDAVCLALIAKNRCIAVRWPIGHAETARRVEIASAGGKLSTNEA